MTTTTTRQGIAQVTRSDGGKGLMRAPMGSYLIAAAACGVTTAVATPLLQYFDPPNIVMLYLLTVLLIAVRLGYGPAFLSAFLSVALFDFFFVPPRFSFTVHDAQYLLTFAVMLAVALITAHLAAHLRYQAELAAAKERRAHALYEIARQLAGAMTLADVDRIAITFLRDALQADSVVLEREANGALAAIAGSIPAWVDTGMAALAFSEATRTDLASPKPVAYFPLIASGRLYGVLAVRSTDESGALLRDNAEFLDTVASLASIVMERLERAR